jgi:hypothetical protein
MVTTFEMFLEIADQYSDRVNDEVSHSEFIDELVAIIKNKDMYEEKELERMFWQLAYFSTPANKLVGVVLHNLEMDIDNIKSSSYAGYLAASVALYRENVGGLSDEEKLGFDIDGLFYKNNEYEEGDPASIRDFIIESQLHELLADL